MADTPEKKIKKKVVAVLKGLNIWHFFPQAGLYGRAGIPDIIGILPNGRFLAIEVKAGRKYGVTPLQEKAITEINKAGGFATVVTGEEGVELLHSTLVAMQRLGV